MLLLLIVIKSSSNFSWHVQCTCTIYIGKYRQNYLLWRLAGEQKSTKAYLGRKSRTAFLNLLHIVYCMYIVIVFRRISKQHIFRFQNIYNVGNITHLTKHIPYLPFWNWIALLLIGKPILKLTMTVVSWTANTKA